ncbi:DNA ligase [Clostridioides difficile]|nr:DNA ligase [Clostridioides difficile]
MKELLEVKNIFNSLANTSGRKEKERILEEHKNNRMFVECLQFLLDTYIVTGISKKKISKTLNNVTYNNINNIYDMIDYLIENNTGKDIDIKTIQVFANRNKELKDFIIGLATKSTKLGVTSKTVNKIMPALIKEFNIMKAKNYKENKESIIGKEFILTTKLDGIRVIVINNKNKIDIFSKQGKIVKGLVDIEQEFIKLPIGIYDGELLAEGIYENSKERFKETLKRYSKKGIKNGLEMYCYDYIQNIDGFYIGKDETLCYLRKNNLENILERCSFKIKHIKYLKPLYQGKDIKVINKYWDEAIDNKEEGIMINLADAPYECERVKHLLKAKEFYTCDIKCIAIEEGNGKYKGVLGNIICDYKGCRIGVGSGFTDEQRKYYFNNQDKIINHVVEIKFFEETNNEKGDLSLRFPIFLRVREVGKEISYN